MHDMLQAHRHGGFHCDAGRLSAALLLLQAHITTAAIWTAVATDAGGWPTSVGRSRRRTPHHQLWHCFMMVVPTAGWAVHYNQGASPSSFSNHRNTLLVACCL